MYDCDPVTMQCRGNPIEIGAMFIGFILYMAAIIIIPIMILTHHSKKKKRDMIIGITTLLLMLIVYVITTAFIVPSIATLFGNDYFMTVIIVGITIIVYPFIDLILFLNNIVKNRY